VTVNMDCYITLYNYVLLFYIMRTGPTSHNIATTIYMFVRMHGYLYPPLLCVLCLHTCMYAYVLLVFVRRIWNLNSMLIKDTAEHVCRLVDIMDIARRGVEESFIWHGGATGHFPVSCSPFSGGMM